MNMKKNGLSFIRIGPTEMTEEREGTNDCSHSDVDLQIMDDVETEQERNSDSERPCRSYDTESGF